MGVLSNVAETPAQFVETTAFEKAAHDVMPVDVYVNTCMAPLLKPVTGNV